MRYCFLLIVFISQAIFKPTFSQVYTRPISAAEYNFFNQINKNLNYNVRFLDSVYTVKAIVSIKYTVDTISHDTIWDPSERYWVQTREYDPNKSCLDCSYGYYWNFDRKKQSIYHSSSGMGGSYFESITVQQNCTIRINGDHINYFSILNNNDTIYSIHDHNISLIGRKYGLSRKFMDPDTLIQDPCVAGKFILVANQNDLSSFDDGLFLASFRIDSLVMKTFNPSPGIERNQSMYRVIVDSIYVDDPYYARKILTQHFSKSVKSNTEYSVTSDTIFLVSDDILLNTKSEYFGIIRKFENEEFYDAGYIYVEGDPFALCRYYSLQLKLDLAFEDLSGFYTAARHFKYFYPEVSKKKYWPRQYKKQIRKDSIADPGFLLLDPFLLYLNPALIND